MTAPTILSDDTVLLLGRLADTLDAQRPDAEMREEIRRARCLVFAEQLHGPTEAAFDAEQDLLAAAPPVRPGQTRGEYAALLRLIAEGVSAG
ncbi:hypothetical protein JHN55_03815 [Streptomyces sp. MBT56]|uniref:hypothetical protein n=1 Tax=unclassified Streptomyces TaxID=2593676 RepID=UPI00190DF8D3|nr:MULTISPECIES: hypothetical protein [unclassified Streptomyces]MBK3555686.1 hypothetical protein [Streptomyces sp. MBT56]MBK3602397.1 hypothetical protein [Streptomyces sp. MBT54]MBK3617298.1 hypothetical protein [Streptomyces sp. MBT98]